MELIPEKYKNKITVITPTIREKDGLFIVQKALEKQNLSEFDWLICSPTEPPKEIWGTWIPDNFKGGFFTLNRAYNALIKSSDAPLLVSWQDYTFSGKNTLKRFWQHYEYDDKMLVSALGHKYETDNWKKRTWEDLRIAGKCNPNYVEWNLCSCPRESLIEIGAFDSEADFLYLGLDGYQVNYRLEETGHTFYCDDKIESFSLGHGRIANWDKDNGMGSGKGEPYQKRVKELKEQNRWPIIGKL